MKDWLLILIADYWALQSSFFRANFPKMLSKATKGVSQQLFPERMVKNMSALLQYITNPNPTFLCIDRLTSDAKLAGVYSCWHLVLDELLYP